MHGDLSGLGWLIFGLLLIIGVSFCIGFTSGFKIGKSCNKQESK